MSAARTKRPGTGRPALGAEKKTRVVKVAFDDVSYAEVCRRAQAARLPPAAYLRRLSERRRSVPPPPPAVNFAAVASLTKYHFGLLDLQRLCQGMIEQKTDPTSGSGELFLIRLRREFEFMHEALGETRAFLLGTQREEQEGRC